MGELEQTEGWEVGLRSRAKGALLCCASPEEPLESCPGLVLCPCWSLIPTPLPSPTQKSRLASPHLSPSPSGNKIKVARDATPVLRKTQLLSCGNRRARELPGWLLSRGSIPLSSLGIDISVLPELLARPGPVLLQSSLLGNFSATPRKAKPI